MSTKDDYIQELEEECFDYLAKVVEILTKHNLWNDDDTYTFDNGDRWSKFCPEEETIDE